VACSLGCGVLVGCLSACGTDSSTLDDLPEDRINLLTGDVDVRVNGDRLPNIGHLCWSDEQPIGVWTTTDRIAIIVYNDWLCPGASLEQPMQVLTGNPRDVVSAGAG